MTSSAGLVEGTNIWRQSIDNKDPIRKDNARAHTSLYATVALHHINPSIHLC